MAAKKKETMMLKELMEAMDLKGIKAVGLLITRDGENLSLVVSPVKTDGTPLANFKAVNTVDELEKDLPGLLGRYSAVLGDNLAELEKDSGAKGKGGGKSGGAKKGEKSELAEKSAETAKAPDKGVANDGESESAPESVPEKPERKEERLEERLEEPELDLGF